MPVLWVRAATTTPETRATLFALVQKLNKIPVQVKDSPGFIVNRVARHYYVKSLKLLKENVADIATVDNYYWKLRALKWGFSG